MASHAPPKSSESQTEQESTIMSRKFVFMILTAAFLGLAAPAHAQKVGPNGGPLGGAGPHQAELVVAPEELTVYLLENGKPHESKGATFRVVVQQEGKTTTINLADDGGKRLVAKLPAPLAKGAIVVLTGKDNHGDQFSARYVVN
jgi:hypothetical protein